MAEGLRVSSIRSRDRAIDLVVGIMRAAENRASGTGAVQDSRPIIPWVRGVRPSAPTGKIMAIGGIKWNAAVSRTR
jgi:hypothetical protein